MISVSGRGEGCLVVLTMTSGRQVKSLILILNVIASCWNGYQKEPGYIKKNFKVDKKYQGKRVQFHFQGVDFEAKFYLNGIYLGEHKGMFTPVVFEVSNQLNYEGDNLLVIVINRAPDEEPQVSKTRYVRNHKSRMTYWWDFCPRMIHLGI